MPHFAHSLVDFEDVDDLSLAVFRAFLHAARLHRRHLMKTLAEHGFHPGQAWCLRALAQSDGITQRDLAEALHLARPTVTRMLQGMEKAGLVVRSPDRSDQRLTRVSLTAAGRDVEGEMRALSTDYVNQTVGALSENDRRQLARLLEKLASSIGAAMAARADAPPAHDSPARAAVATDAMAQDEVVRR